MGIKRIRDWSYPAVEDIEGLLQWARDHHREHMEESAARILDLSEFDHAKYMSDVYLSSTQANLVDTTWTTVELDTEITDSGSRFDTTTFTYTSPMERKYYVSGSVAFTNCVVDKWYAMRILKGASTTVLSSAQYITTGNALVQGSRLISLDAGDTLKLQAISYSGDNTVDVYGNATVQTTWMTVYIVG